MSPSDRRAVLEAGIAGLLVALIHLAFRLSSSFVVGALNDDGVYVVLGKALAQGAGYRSIHLVSAPLQVRYPPGLPLLLAVPWLLTGSLGAVRATVAVVNLLVTATAAALVWWVGRERLRASAWLVAVCAIGPFALDGAIQYYNIPLTEPYLVLGWAAALVVAYPLFESDSASTATGRAAAVGLVLAATALFRSAGLVLLPAVVLALAIQRRWRAAAIVAGCGIVPLVSWRGLEALWAARGGSMSASPDDLGYWHWLGVTGPFAFLAYAGGTMIRNFIEYVPKLASYLSSTLALGIVLVLAALGAAIAASVRRWRAHGVLVLTAAALGVLTLLWPFAQGRLLLPLLPFFGLLAAAGVDPLIARLPTGSARLVVPVACLVIVVLVGVRQVELRRAAARAYATGTIDPRDTSPAMTLAFRSRFISFVDGWLEANTTAADRIMVDAPAAVFLYTGRHTVAADPTESRYTVSVFAEPGRYLAQRILEDSVSLVVWAPPAAGLQRDLETIAARCPGVLQRQASPVALFFRVRRDETCLRERVLAATESHVPSD